MVLPPLNGLSLCSGGGGLDMGLGLAEPGFHTRCWVEWEDYPRQTLIAGMQAGYLAPAPIWDNVKTFDAKPFAGAFDTIVAGYPCQPFSMAGQRKGEDDERHLWPDIERHIEDLGPQLRWCFFENVSGHLSLGLDTVLDALRRLGFATAVGVFSAEEVGASHERQRVFIVAHREGPDGRCELEPGSAGRGRDGLTGSGSELAHADGGDTGPERQQRGGEQRFQPEGGRSGGESLANACVGRCGRPGQGQDQQPRGTETERSGDQLDHPEGVGCGQGRPEPEFRSGRDTSASADSELDHPQRDGRGTRGNGDHPGHVGQQLDPEGCPMADGVQPGLEGHPRHGDRGREPGRQLEEARRPACQSGAPLFPPGPNDRGAWDAVIRSTPGRAPSVSRRDTKTAALNFASVLDPDQAARIQSRAAGFPRTHILRTLGGEAAQMVGSEAAVTELCRMAYGLADRARALRLLGNGVCPLAAAYAWRTLSAAHRLGWVDLGKTEYFELGQAPAIGI